jgi:hypothetical protein
MTSFSFKKSALAVSASAALLALSLTNTAQAANDVGQLIINAQISNTTCLLAYVNDGAATAANSKTLNLGTYQVAAASAVAAGGNIGTSQRVNLALKAADGVTACSFNTPTTLWDVGINIPPANFETLSSGATALKNTATANAATGVGVVLLTGHSLIGTGTGVGNVNFNAPTATYGNLLSNPASTSPAIPKENWLAIAPYLARTTGPVGAGVYTHTIPLNVYYR